MDIELPDGTTLKDIPEGTTKEQVKAKLVAGGKWNPEWDAATNVGTDNSPEAVAASDARAEAIAKKGAQPERNNFTKLTGAMSELANGATFGFGDEMSAALAAPAIALTTGDTLAGGYDKAAANIRGNMKQVEGENPVTAGGLQVAGAIAGGKALGGAAQAVLPGGVTSALANFASRNPLKVGGLVGMGSGALTGVGNGEDTDSRMQGAIAGGAVGLPAGVAGGALAKAFGGPNSLLTRAFSGDADNVAAVGNALPAGPQPSQLPPAVGAPAMQAPVAPQQSALARISGRVGATLDDAAGILTPEQMERAKVLKEVGINNPTAAMISRDPKTWQFERNTAGIDGVGDPIRQRYVDSNARIQESLQALGKSTGGKATTPYEAGESVVDAVTSKSNEMQKTIGDMYGKIRTEVGADKGLQPSRLLTALDTASDNAYADNIVNSMTRKMKRYGVIDAEGKAVDGAALSISQAEELRKFANSMKGDRQTDRVVGDVIDALDDDVIETAGSDAFKTARDAARDRFKEFESKILGGVTDGKVVADDVLRKTVFGGKVADVQALKSSLLSGSDDQIARGSQAWNDLKLQTLQTITDAATSAGGKLSGASLNRQLDKIGKERLETIFDPTELLKLKTIQKAAEYTTIEVPESFVNYSGTGVANVNNALSGLLQSSKVGNFMTSLANGVSQVPLVGAAASPVTALARMGGQNLKSAAQQNSVKNVLNPLDSALSRFANPTSVMGGGMAGGSLANQFTPNKK